MSEEMQKDMDKLSVVVLFLLEQGEITSDELAAILAEADLADISEDEEGEFVANIPDVRRVAAEKGSQKQLEKMIKDPDLDVRYILAYRGNKKVRRQLLYDENENVRKYAKECLEFGGEEKD